MSEERLVVPQLEGAELRTVTEFVEAVRDRFDGQVRAMILFGSRARGEAEPGSDMDVLVVMGSVDVSISKKIRHLAVEVWLKHGIYISTRVWSQAHWRRLAELQTLLYQNIRRDGIDLLSLTSPTN